MDDIELGTIVWRAPEWINALGGLRADNVLEYFSQSPFYDRSSNNAVLKMQSQFQSFGDVNSALRKMTGIEFVVSSAFPPDLFTIAKQEREGVDDARVLSVFMIANGNIYLAPDVHKIVTSRMLNVTHALKASIDLLQANLTFDPASGHSFARHQPKKQAEDKTADLAGDKSTSTLSMAEVQSMHKVLYNAVNRLT